MLPLCFGEATKISQFLLESDKVYRARFRFGVRTGTGDREGEVIAQHDASGLRREQVEAALRRFEGAITQTPSMFSALKHQGVPLYKLAREGVEVERKPRQVTVYDIRLLDFADGAADVEIHCSKGTYVRSIADDLGENLEVGAHVEELRRLKAGPFAIDACVSFERLAQSLEEGGFAAVDAFLVPSDEAVRDLPAVRLPAATASFVKQGQPVIARHLPTEGLVRLYEESDFIGIGAILDDGRVAPRRLMKA